MAMYKKKSKKIRNKNQIWKNTSLDGTGNRGKEEIIEISGDPATKLFPIRVQLQLPTPLKTPTINVHI